MDDDPDLEAVFEVLRRRQGRKQEGYFLDLQPNERAIVDAASRIYAAYVQAGRVADGEESRMTRKAIQVALKIALDVERWVADPQEGRSEWG